MKLTVLVISVALASAGCDDKPQTRPARAAATPRATISPDRHDYLSTAMRARDSAQRQLGEVQRERKDQVEFEKTFDRPVKQENSP